MRSPRAAERGVERVEEEPDKVDHEDVAKSPAHGRHTEAGHSIDTWGGTAREAVAAHARPAAGEVPLGGLAAYLASPIDIIPDAVPGGGYLDDLLLLSFVASFVLAKVPPEVVREHWGEDVQVLERIRNVRGKTKEE